MSTSQSTSIRASPENAAPGVMCRLMHLDMVIILSSSVIVIFTLGRLSPCLPLCLEQLFNILPSFCLLAAFQNFQRVSVTFAHHATILKLMSHITARLPHDDIVMRCKTSLVVRCGGPNAVDRRHRDLAFWVALREPQTIGAAAV